MTDKNLLYKKQINKIKIEKKWKTSIMPLWPQM